MAPLKIAVLDDYQDFAPPHFDGLGHEVSYFKDTQLPYSHKDAPKDKLASRLEPFDVISTMRERTPFPKELIERLPNLKLLLTNGSRNLALDIDTFKNRGITVAGSGGTGTAPLDSTTEQIITMILAVTRNIADDDFSVKTGGWQTSPVTGISGKTLGLVGLGRLGTNVAKVFLVSFGVKIIAWSSNLTQEKADEAARGAGLPTEDANGEKTFKAVSREKLFSQADVVSVHLVLSDRSRGLVKASDFSLMKPSSFFVNTSRGPLVVEKDLLDTLTHGKIRGAALDVFDIEPLPSDSLWRTQEWGKNGRSHVLLTPHIAYVERDAIGQWYELQAANLKRWIAGDVLEALLT